MKRLTVNRANWSGKTGKIEYADAGAFLVEDIDGMFALTKDKDMQGTDCYTVKHKNYGTYRGYIFNSPNGKYVIFSDGGVQREHANPLVAFARLAWSIF